MEGSPLNELDNIREKNKSLVTDLKQLARS